MSRHQHKGPLAFLRQRETIEMLDGRVYFSDDNWQTVFRQRRDDSRHRVVTGKEADLARFIAVAQSSAGPS